MESIIRGLVVYGFLLFLFRMAGNRTLSQTTSFDLVLLLIISETTQEAMVNGDHSITNSFLLIMTLVGTTVLLSVLKQKFPGLQPLLESAPLIVVDNGRPLKDRMDHAHVDEEEILEAARQRHGLEQMRQIKYAIVEGNGEISIIPWEGSVSG